MALCAGLSADGTSAGILASNYDAKEDRLVLTLEGLPWKGPGRYEVFLVDPEHDLELVEEGPLQPAVPLEVRRLKAPAVALIKLRPDR